LEVFPERNTFPVAPFSLPPENIPHSGFGTWWGLVPTFPYLLRPPSQPPQYSFNPVTFPKPSPQGFFEIGSPSAKAEKNSPFSPYPPFFPAVGLLSPHCATPYPPFPSPSFPHFPPPATIFLPTYVPFPFFVSPQAPFFPSAICFTNPRFTLERLSPDLGPPSPWNLPLEK